MASVQQDPSGNFHISFRFGGKRYKRSLKTKIRRKAEASASHVEENIRLIQRGRMAIPDDVDVPTYLLSDGKLASKPRVHRNLRLSEFFTEYNRSIPEGSLEPTTWKVIGVHMRHVCRILGGDTTIRSIRTEELQQYITTRSTEKGRHKERVSAVTIGKELSTFGSLWKWAESRELVTGAFPREGVMFPKHDEKPPFQTWAQISRQVDRDRLDAEQAAPLWHSLYLSTHEVQELLDYVRLDCRHAVLHPMCVVAAYTGARRSELCRARTSDFDLQAGTFAIRERKRSRTKRTTRSVPLTSTVRSVLLDWLDVKPATQFMFPAEHLSLREPPSGCRDHGAVSPEEASRYFNRTLGKSKWSVIRGWHVFRHSFISNCASRGVDQRFIDEWVGHQTDEQRRRYRHLFPDSQMEAIESVFS